MAFLKRVTAPLRLVDKRAEAAVARNVTPRKTLARERAQNKINECYSRLFCSFLSVIFIHIIRNITKLKCLCGEHPRDNLFLLSPLEERECLSLWKQVCQAGSKVRNWLCQAQRSELKS